MSGRQYPPLDITGQWSNLNGTLVDLVDSIPEDKLDWSPRDDLWNLRGILVHTIMTRDNWLGGFAKDGVTAPNVLEAARSKDDIKTQLNRSWERLATFLSDPARLTALYRWGDPDREMEASGHWMAFHLLEHDIHHRADVFHYLALLNVAHPDVGTP